MYTFRTDELGSVYEIILAVHNKAKELGVEIKSNSDFKQIAYICKACYDRIVTVDEKTAIF